MAEAGAQEATSDVDILNYALALEYLQAAFYTEAERRARCAVSSLSRHGWWAPTSAPT